MSSKPAVTLNWQGRKAPSPPRTEDLVTVKRGDSGCVLIQEDNLLALAALVRQKRRKFALAYLDPPFFTGREHTRVERSKNPKTGRIARKLVPAFDDRWHSFEDYLSALLERVNLVYDLLEEDGCMVLHVDPKTSHYAKVLCDEVFGQRCFASEIIWRYRRWPSKTNNFQRVHDVLLRYVKNPDKAPRFRQLYEPLAPSTLATWGDRKQRAVVSPKGQRLRSSTTAEKTKGTPLGDVWEIGIVAPVARERTGYPTQKPEALLERLIEACTHPGDWILDPYLGSGTTLSVALRLERRAVGIDRSLEALHTTRSRLQDLAVRASEQRLAARPLVHETAVASARAAS